MSEPRPTLVLSEHFAHLFAAELRDAAPDAYLITHNPDGEWSGDADEGTVAYLSSDMWRHPKQRALLARFPEMAGLRWVHTSSAGVDNAAFARLLAKGVTLTNSAGVNSIAIAQHSLALMLAHARHLTAYAEQQRRGHWERIESDELTDATVLVIGLGGIGSEVARLCAAFRAHVVGVRRGSVRPPGVEVVVTPDRLMEVLPAADHVVLACPLTPQTRGLIGEAALAAMKPTAYVVNVARGPIIDTPALVDALHTGRIAGAALDVFDSEPLPPESELWSVPNLTITPHSAGSSPHNPVRAGRFFVANLARHVRGEPLENTVTSVE